MWAYRRIGVSAYRRSNFSVSAFPRVSFRQKRGCGQSAYEDSGNDRIAGKIVPLVDGGNGFRRCDPNEEEGAAAIREKSDEDGDKKEHRAAGDRQSF